MQKTKSYCSVILWQKKDIRHDISTISCFLQEINKPFHKSLLMLLFLLSGIFIVGKYCLKIPTASQIEEICPLFIRERLPEDDEGFSRVL